MQRAGRRARVAPSRFSPDEEHARPQLGGGLTSAVLARQVQRLAAREGVRFRDLSVGQAMAKIVAHMHHDVEELHVRRRELR